MKALWIWLWLTIGLIGSEMRIGIPDIPANEQLLAARRKSTEEAVRLYPDVLRPGSELRKAVRHLVMDEVWIQIYHRKMPPESLTFPLPLVQKAAATVGAKPATAEEVKELRRQEQLLRQIVIPRFYAEEMPFETALDFVVSEARRLALAGSGLKIHFGEGVEKQLEDERQQPETAVRVTMDLRNIPLGELLRYLTRLRGGYCTVTVSGIQIDFFKRGDGSLDLTTMMVDT